MKFYNSDAFSIVYTGSIPVCPGYVPSCTPTLLVAYWRGAECYQWNCWASAHVLLKDYQPPTERRKGVPLQTTSTDPEILFGKGRGVYATQKQSL